MRNVENPIVLLKTQEGKQIILFFEMGKVHLRMEKSSLRGRTVKKHY
jgi:hypothetical protein